MPSIGDRDDTTRSLYISLPQSLTRRNSPGSWTISSSWPRIPDNARTPPAYFLSSHHRHSHSSSGTFGQITLEQARTYTSLTGLAPCSRTTNQFLRAGLTSRSRANTPYALITSAWCLPRRPSPSCSTVGQFSRAGLGDSPTTFSTPRHPLSTIVRLHFTTLLNRVSVEPITTFPLEVDQLYRAGLDDSITRNYRSLYNYLAFLHQPQLPRRRNDSPEPGSTHAPITSLSSCQSSPTIAH